MNARKFLLNATAFVLAGGATNGLWANQLPGEMVSGNVTSVSGNTSININGRVYRIKTGSPAADAARKVSAGQPVDAQLNGPASASASEVVNLVTRTSR